MQNTVERIHIGKQFGDIPRGIYLIRGENVALCGEIVSHTHTHSHSRSYTHTHTTQDSELEGRQELEKVSIDVILEAQRVEQERKEEERKKREQLLRSRGMRPLDHEYDT